MSLVQNIEAAVGKDDALSLLLPEGDQFAQLGQIHDFRRAAAVTPDGVEKFGTAHRAGAGLADDHACGGIGAAGRFLIRKTAGTTGGQHGDHRVACPGNVHYLPGFGLDEERFLFLFKQRHAPGPSGQQQPGNGNAAAQGAGFALHFFP